MKANKITKFKLPYVVLISKFTEHFRVYVEGEVEESTGLLNHVSTLNMHKMRFTKFWNTWLVEGKVAANVEVGANDHEVETSGANQDEDDASNPQHMAIVIYHPLEDNGSAYVMHWILNLELNNYWN